jgi:SH3-like domain-containing protein
MRWLSRTVITMAAAGMSMTALMPATGAPAQKRVPYYASISAGKARMRAGPGRTYPVIWLYQRADLPVKVLAVYDRGPWLKVEDPGGTQGWMLQSLVKDVRTGFVMGAPADLLDQPNGARVRWRAASGVVGRLSRCARGWCYFDIRGRGGYVEATRLWGVDSDEVLP